LAAVMERLAELAGAPLSPVTSLNRV
jgi:hypothetical protein